MNDWTLYERGGEMEFQTAIRSPRLSKWLGEVWESLPVKDRNQINDRLMLVSDNSILRFILESAEFPERMLYGCAVPIAGGRQFIFLNASELRRKPAAFCRYVIAHELAHVFHGHSDGTNKDHEAEAEADATAARWGYQEHRFSEDGVN